MKIEAVTASRKAKVSPEHLAEAQRLSSIWAVTPHETQAVFGEKYEIGNQSAVGQFLRGETPLSIKAAKGFAEGLGCSLADFSPRLAKEAAEVGALVSGSAEKHKTDKPDIKYAVGSVPDLLELAKRAQSLPPTQRKYLVMLLSDLVNEPEKAAEQALEISRLLGSQSREKKDLQPSSTTLRRGRKG